MAVLLDALLIYFTYSKVYGRKCQKELFHEEKFDADASPVACLGM